jgi:hypothetical protein
VVPADDYNGLATSLGNLVEKLVVELLGSVARRTGIENITGDQQNVYLLMFDGLDQPAKK